MKNDIVVLIAKSDRRRPLGAKWDVLTCEDDFDGGVLRGHCRGIRWLVVTKEGLHSPLQMKTDQEAFRIQFH
jgi:hypothetical protein